MVLNISLRMMFMECKYIRYCANSVRNLTGSGEGVEKDGERGHLLTKSPAQRLLSNPANFTVFYDADFVRPLSCPQNIAMCVYQIAQKIKSEGISTKFFFHHKQKNHEAKSKKKQMKNFLM